MNDRLANNRAITNQLLCDNFRPDVVNDVISGLDVEQVGVNDPVKFGDFWSNRSRDIRLPHFVRTTTPAYAGHRIRAKRRGLANWRLQVEHIYRVWSSSGLVVMTL